MDDGHEDEKRGSGSLEERWGLWSVTMIGMIGVMLVPQSVYRVVEIRKDKEGQCHTDEGKDGEVENLIIVSKDSRTCTSLTVKSCQRNKKRCAVKNFGTFLSPIARTVLYAFEKVSIHRILQPRAYWGVFGCCGMPQHVDVIDLETVRRDPVDKEHPGDRSEPTPIDYFIWNIFQYGQDISSEQSHTHANAGDPYGPALHRKRV